MVRRRSGSPQSTRCSRLPRVTAFSFPSRLSVALLYQLGLAFGNLHDPDGRNFVKRLYRPRAGPSHRQFVHHRRLSQAKVLPLGTLRCIPVAQHDLASLPLPFATAVIRAPMASRFDWTPTSSTSSNSASTRCVTRRAYPWKLTPRYPLPLDSRNRRPPRRGCSSSNRRRMPARSPLLRR